MSTALITLSTICSLTVIWTSICALNRMDHSTPLLMRVAYVMLAVGGAAVLLAPVYLHRAPTCAEVLMVTGGAAFGIHVTLRFRMKKITRFLRSLRRRPA